MGSFESGIESLIPIVAILSSVALPIGLGMYMGLRNISTKHKERMALINQGIIPPEQTKPTPNKYRSLRNGFLCIGIALGLIVGMIFSQLAFPDIQWRFFILSGSVLLFLGLAYVAFYMMVKDKKEFDDDAE